MKLSVELEKWRTDRPDEWKMDEFVRKAENLEAERDALAATVEALRLAALNAISFMSGGEAKAQLRDAYDAIPQQHLAEIRVNAIHEAIEYATENYGEVLVSELVEYADSIRKESK